MTQPTGDPVDSSGTPQSSAGQVKTGRWVEGRTKLRRKSFPGPPDARELLRVAMSRQAYADLIAHAKESLNAEICGVLAGDLYQDDLGVFVSVEAVIKGAAARKGSTHVTFTQETWNQIHAEMKQRHEGLQIVGWYHSHPGFGVQFSDMDLFIQRNFFGGPGQIAFVVDPLGGEEAILVNSDGQALPIARFWVDGRERRCKTEIVGRGKEADVNSNTVNQAIKSMEERITQLMGMLEAQSASNYRLLLAMGFVIALAVCLFIGNLIYSTYTSQYRPPEVQGFVPVPVKVGDKSVLLGVGILKWEVPPSLNAALVQIEREKQAEAQSAGGTPATTQPATSQPATNPATKPAK